LIQALDDRIAAVEDLIEAALARHELAEVIIGLPGMGTVLAGPYQPKRSRSDQLPAE
jgi:hypothetical protein